MNLRPGHKEDPVEINLTPLIDVVFLLLIFFMVSTTFERHARLKVSLPEASAKAVQMQDKPVTLSVDARGRYYIDDRQLVNTQLETLKRGLRRVLAARGGKPADQVIVLRADGRARHQAVVRAMDAVSQLGITRLSIATVESRQGE